MDRLTKQIIRCKVMQYPHLRNKIANEIANASEPRVSASAVSGGYCSVRCANGFEDKLLHIMSQDDYLWCEAIESAVNYFNERGREEIVKAVDELYWKSKLNVDGVARVLQVSRAHVYFYISDFFEMIHKYAIKSGVVKEI